MSEVLKHTLVVINMKDAAKIQNVEAGVHEKRQNKEFRGEEGNQYWCSWNHWVQAQRMGDQNELLTGISCEEQKMATQGTQK